MSETTSHCIKLTLRTEVWDWVRSEADFLNRSQSAHFSDLITTLYDCQMGKPPEVIEFVPDTGPDWEEIVKKEGGIYG